MGQKEQNSGDDAVRAGSSILAFYMHQSTVENVLRKGEGEGVERFLVGKFLLYESIKVK
jgi:hypothetical protein